MSAILKYDFQKRKQLNFSEENYLNYTKNTKFYLPLTFLLKLGETSKSSVMQGVLEQAVDPYGCP